MRNYCYYTFLLLLSLMILQCGNQPEKPKKFAKTPATSADTEQEVAPEEVEDVIPDLGGDNTTTSSIAAIDDMIVDESSWDDLLAQGRPQIAYPSHPSKSDAIYRLRYQDIELKYYLEDIIALHSYLQDPSNILIPEESEFTVVHLAMHHDRYTEEELGYPFVRQNYHAKNASLITNPAYLALRSPTVVLAESRKLVVARNEQLLQLYSTMFKPKKEDNLRRISVGRVFFFDNSYTDFSSLMYKNHDSINDWLLTAKEDQFELILDARPKTGMVSQTAYVNGGINIDLRPEEKAGYLADLKARPITTEQANHLQQMREEYAAVASELTAKRDAMEAEYKAAYHILNPTELELLQVVYATSTDLLMIINAKEAQLASVLKTNNSCEDLMLLLQITDNSKMDWSAYSAKNKEAELLRWQIKANYLTEIRQLEKELELAMQAL